MTGPRIAIVQLLDPSGTVPVGHSLSVFEFACELMRDGCAVSLIPWAGASLDALLHDLATDADRILLWDPDVRLDLPATYAALGDTKLLAALDAADVVSAPTMRSRDTLAVFSSRELFSRQREGLGSDLMGPMQRERQPVVMAAAGNFWLWLHTSAISRLTPPPPNPFLIDGIDVTLARRLVEGGCTARCDPRISVMSTWKETAQWAVEAPEVEGGVVAGGVVTDTASAETAPVTVP